LPERFPRKFDNKGYFVAEMGVALSGDVYIIPEKMFIRMTTAHYYDCADLPAEQGRNAVNALILLILILPFNFSQASNLNVRFSALR